MEVGQAGRDESSCLAESGRLGLGRLSLLMVAYERVGTHCTGNRILVPRHDEGRGGGGFVAIVVVAGEEGLFDDVIDETGSEACRVEDRLPLEHRAMVVFFRNILRKPKRAS